MPPRELSDREIVDFADALDTNNDGLLSVDELLAIVNVVRPSLLLSLSP